MTRSHSASATSANADMLSMIPALLTRTSTPPNRSTAVVDHPVDDAWLTEVPDDGDRAPPVRSISLTTAVGAAGVEVGHHDPGALLGEGSAAARPMPEPAPVTMTLRPSSPPLM